jgi:hypothetical protein
LLKLNLHPGIFYVQWLIDVGVEMAWFTHPNLKQFLILVLQLLWRPGGLHWNNFMAHHVLIPAIFSPCAFYKGKNMEHWNLSKSFHEAGGKEGQQWRGCTKIKVEYIMCIHGNITTNPWPTLMN